MKILCFYSNAIWDETRDYIRYIRKIHCCFFRPRFCVETIKQPRLIIRRSHSPARSSKISRTGAWNTASIIVSKRSSGPSPRQRNLPARTAWPSIKLSVENLLHWISRSGQTSRDLKQWEIVEEKKTEEDWVVVQHSASN